MIKKVSVLLCKLVRLLTWKEVRLVRQSDPNDIHVVRIPKNELKGLSKDIHHLEKLMDDGKIEILYSSKEGMR